MRDLCGEFGDNDWDENLSLADVVGKHLGSTCIAKLGVRTMNRRSGFIFLGILLALLVLLGLVLVLWAN